MKRKLLIFGIDGGTFRIIEPMWAAGHLPNLARLKAEGAAGVLTSVVPPLTAPAWATFQTGLNPGRHGVFDFLAPPRLGYNRPLQNAAALGAPRLFDALSSAGRTVGVINTPLTFPPRPVNGFVIPGMLTPAVKDKFLYPPSLGAEIREIGAYYIDMDPVNYEEGRDEEFRADLYRVSEARKKVALALFRAKRPDLFTIVFTGVDRLMHFFWDRPDWVCEHYAWLDAAVGEFREAAGEEATTLVVSDHGFGPASAEVNLAGHLVRRGFMVVREGARPSPRRVMGACAKLDFLKIRKRLPGRWRAAARASVLEKLSAFAAVDWSRTKAYAIGLTGIFLNIAGREAQGIVAPGNAAALKAEIKAKLTGLRDGGAVAVNEVYDLAAIYQGPYLADGPELVVGYASGWRASWDSATGRVGAEVFEDNVKAWSGDHCIASDLVPGVLFSNARIATERPRIIDLAPTVLDLFGLAVPPYMEGRPLALELAPAKDRKDEAA